MKIFGYNFRDEYELAKKEGDKRFGNECNPEKVKKGRCLKCLRRVI